MGGRPMKRGTFMTGVLALVAASTAAQATPTYPSLGQMDDVRQLSRQISITAARVHQAATPYARAGYPGELEALEKIRLVSPWARQVAQEMQNCGRPTGFGCRPEETIFD